MPNHQCRFGYLASSASFTFMMIRYKVLRFVTVEFGHTTPKGLCGIVTIRKRYYQEPIILSIGETGGRASYCARSYCHVKPVLGTTLTECWSSVTSAALLNLKRLSSVSAICTMVARMGPHNLRVVRTCCFYTTDLKLFRGKVKGAHLVSLCTWYNVLREHITKLVLSYTVGKIA